MIRHNKKVIVEPAYFEAEPDDSYQVKWLCDVMNSYRFNCRHIADILNVRRQTVNNWLHDKSPMELAYVFTLCKSLDLIYDPYDVYQKMRK